MTLFTKDAIERVAWTVIQVVAGIVAVDLTGINTWWSVAIAGGIVVVKTFAGTQTVSNPLGSLSLSVLERLGWTAAQASLGLIVVNNVGLPIAYVPIASAVLVMLKAFVGKRVGSPDTAATLPAMLDPYAPNPLLPASSTLYDAPVQPIPLPPHPVQSAVPIPVSMVTYDPAKVMPTAYPGKAKDPEPAADETPAEPKSS